MNKKALTLINNMALFRKQYHNFVNERVANLEITSSEFSYLKQLVNNDGALQDIIVKNTCVDKAATTRIAQSLEKKDIIKRVRNEKDKRNFNVYLTEKGKNFFKNISLSTELILFICFRTFSIVSLFIIFSSILSS